MSKSVSGSSREGGKEMQLCSLGKTVRWKIDQSDAKLVPFATFRNATRRNCHTFPCDFIQQICTIFISFAFFVSFRVFASCCSLLVSISWINQREFTIYNSQFSCNLQIELGRGTVRIWLSFMVKLELWVSVTVTVTATITRQPRHSHGRWWAWHLKCT